MLITTTIITWLILRFIFIQNGVYRHETFKNFIYRKINGSFNTNVLINTQKRKSFNVAANPPLPFTIEKDLMKYWSENDVYKQRMYSALRLFQQLYHPPVDKKDTKSPHLEKISEISENSTHWKIEVMTKRSFTRTTQRLDVLEKELLSLTSKIDTCRHTPWFEHITTCKDLLKWNNRNLDKLQRTSVMHSSVNVFKGDKHGIPNMIHIITYTSDNKTKTQGGDYFRIFLVEKSKQFKMNINLVDLNNGEYSGLFYVPELGNFEIHIILEYSVCEGLTDPPEDWFRKGKFSSCVDLEARQNH